MDVHKKNSYCRSIGDIGELPNILQKENQTMSTIPDETVIEKCLAIVNVQNYRHPFADHGSNKLFTGKAISILIDAILRQHDTLDDVAENLKSKNAFKELIGLDSIHGSTIHRKLECIPTDFLQGIAESILEQIHHHYKKGDVQSLGALRIVDSSQISLPEVFGKWAYTSKDKNSVKIHLRLVMMNEETTYPDKVICTTGAVSDSEVAVDLVLDPDATHVMDRGYINYHLFHEWTAKSIKFVTRVKQNSKLTVLSERLVPDGTNILSDSDVTIRDPKTGENYTVRLVEYEDEEGKNYRVVTNRWDVSALGVAEIYRMRWKIELFFKWLKQHVKLVKLYNHKQVAVWNQIWLAIIAYGLCEIIKIQTKTNLTTWQVLKKMRHYWFDTWEHFKKVLHRNPTRSSKGRKKKGKPGRKRKYPKKYKPVKIVANS